MAVLTVYPDEHPEISSVDGFAERVADNSTWAELRDGAGTTALDVDGFAYAASLQAGTNTDRWWKMRRAILLFDTSSIPDGATIVSATLSIYGKSKFDTLNMSPSLNVYASTPYSNTALQADDYVDIDSTPFSDTAITYANFNTGDPGTANTFALNAAGLAAISKTSVTKLGLREVTADVADTPPSWASGYPYFEFNIWFSDKGDDAYRPKLVVTYAAGVYPTDAQTRVTSLIHRYDRGTYTLEIGLGEVTADFGLPEPAPKPRTALPEAQEREIEQMLRREEAIRERQAIEVPPPDTQVMRKQDRRLWEGADIIREDTQRREETQRRETEQMLERERALRREQAEEAQRVQEEAQRREIEQMLARDAALKREQSVAPKRRAPLPSESLTEEQRRLLRGF